MAGVMYLCTLLAIDYVLLGQFGAGVVDMTVVELTVWSISAASHWYHYRNHLLSVRTYFLNPHCADSWSSNNT